MTSAIALLYRSINSEHNRYITALHQNPEPRTQNLPNFPLWIIACYAVRLHRFVLNTRGGASWCAKPASLGSTTRRSHRTSAMHLLRTSTRMIRNPYGGIPVGSRTSRRFSLPMVIGAADEEGCGMHLRRRLSRAKLTHQR